MYRNPAVKPVSRADVRDLSDRLKLGIPEEEIDQYKKSMAESLKVYNDLEQFPDPMPPVTFPRTPGYRPDPADNPCNAWTYVCEVRGAPEGLLAGRRVAIKDSIPVAGVPMENGCRALRGYIPDYDATVVTRILNAGGIVAGKAACEDLCYSGSSVLMATGPVLNPHSPKHSAGGSSSGCAALIACGAVDLAVGGDQGGSVRLPACWSGCVGFKPTYGLVPYTGACGMTLSLDHLGPMTATVSECALLLQVMAGYDDGLDPRQGRDVPLMQDVPKYSEHVDDDVTSLRVGVLNEGFNNCEEGVASLIRQRAQELKTYGLTVEDVSVPMFSHGHRLILPQFNEGIATNMISGGGVGVGPKGFYPTSFLTAYHTAITAHSNLLAPTVKKTMMMSQHIQDNHGLQYYAHSMNLTRTLSAAIDEILKTCDVIILPTIPYTASKLPQEDIGIKDLINHCLENVQNTAPFNLTGHPVLNIPIGKCGGLPVGLSVVGRFFDEITVLKVARTIEKLCNNK